MCLIPMTLWQSQGNLIWHEYVDPKEGDHHAKFEKPIQEKVCFEVSSLRKHVNCFP